MKIDIAKILDESDEIAFNNSVSRFLGNFIKRTHKAQYLLRIARINAITSVNTGPRVLTTGSGGIYYTPSIDDIYYKVFGIDFDLKAYIDSNSGYPPDIYIYNDFLEDDNFKSFDDQFILLKKVIEEEVRHSVNEFSLLKALYDVSISIFGCAFEEQLGINRTHTKQSIIEGLTHSSGNFKASNINFIAVGEAACYFVLNGWASDFHRGFREITEEIQRLLSMQEVEEFRALIAIAPEPEEMARSVTSINSTDYLSGTEFERLVGRILQNDGYSIFYTASVGDQGVDLVAQKDGVKLAVQAKRYAGKVTNSAIQEVVAGKTHYMCDKALVVTNSYFTLSAISLSRSNDVLLWDRDLLEKKISWLGDSH